MLALGSAAWLLAARIKSVVSALDPDLVCIFFIALLVAAAFILLYTTNTPGLLGPGIFKGREFDIAPIVRQFTWILRYTSGNQFFRLSPNTSNK